MKKSKKRDAADAILQEIFDALRPYKDEHPQVEIEVRRSNPASVGVRIVDKDFRGVDRLEREKRVWPLIEKLTPDTQSELSMLVLVTPEERNTSIASLTFQEFYVAPGERSKPATAH